MGCPALLRTRGSAASAGLASRACLSGGTASNQVPAPAGLCASARLPRLAAPSDHLRGAGTRPYGRSGLAGGNGLAERFGQQQCAKALALLAAVGGEPGEQDHAGRVGGEAVGKPRWCFCPQHRAHRQAEVSGDVVLGALAATGEQEGPGGVHLLDGEVAAQPGVEFLQLAAQSYRARSNRSRPRLPGRNISVRSPKSRSCLRRRFVRKRSQAPRLVVAATNDFWMVG